MTEETNKSKAGAELWARAREGWRVATAAPDAPDSMTLAAYLDGTLDQAARERVEAWMAASPEALDLMISARSAQAEAVRHGISRALLGVEADFRPPLKRAGFLTRDDRKKERKKPGLRGARRGTQFSKR